MVATAAGLTSLVNALRATSKPDTANALLTVKKTASEVAEHRRNLSLLRRESNRLRGWAKIATRGNSKRGDGAEEKLTALSVRPTRTGLGCWPCCLARPWSVSAPLNIPATETLVTLPDSERSRYGSSGTPRRRRLAPRSRGARHRAGRLSSPNDRLRLRFGEALARIGQRYRDLGFRRSDLYVKERASRPGRWGAESRRLAERLEHLPRLRDALVRGAVSWSMAELGGRYLETRGSREDPQGQPDSEAREERVDEAQLVALAERSTVRQMREAFSKLNRVGVGQPRRVNGPMTRRPVRRRNAFDCGASFRSPSPRIGRDPPRDSTSGWRLEGRCARVALAEAHTRMVPSVPPELDPIAGEVESRFRDRAARRASALAECERDEAIAEGDLRTGCTSRSRGSTTTKLSLDPSQRT